MGPEVSFLRKGVITMVFYIDDTSERRELLGECLRLLEGSIEIKSIEILSIKPGEKTACRDAEGSNCVVVMVSMSSRIEIYML